jgi:hypothetical protein
VLPLVPKIDDLVEQNEGLPARIDDFQARIAELEGRAGSPPKTPTNSSLPPSSGQKARPRATGLGGACDGRLFVIVADQWWLERRAASQHCGHRQHESKTTASGSAEFLRPVDGVDECAEGFLRSRSASFVVSNTTVRIAVHRSVAERLAERLAFS